MADYIEGFILPIPEIYLKEYKKVAEEVAEIWKKYGALSYNEFVGDDLFLEGTMSFDQIIDLKEGEVIIFGWVVFPSKEVRNYANEKVPNDPLMKVLVEPLCNPERLIFDAGRMVYGGFKPIVQSIN